PPAEIDVSADRPDPRCAPSPALGITGITAVAPLSAVRSALRRSACRPCRLTELEPCRGPAGIPFRHRSADTRTIPPTSREPSGRLRVLPGGNMQSRTSARPFRWGSRGLVATAALFVLSASAWGQTPVPMLSQPANTYTENFGDITNWTTG